jgi:predicted ATP-grasp superfamily ATP-dependent carboligase
MFPTPTRAQIERCNDKWQLMQLCAQLEVDHPATALVRTDADISRVTTAERVVVKPLSEGFGFGVHELASVAELRDHLARDDRPGNAFPQIVQEHVPGVDIDVTILVDQGTTVVGVVQERLPDGRSMRFSTDRRFLEPAERLAAATAFHGMMDFDLRHDHETGRVVVIECNPRFPGSLLNKTWAGANLALDGVALALGFPIAATGAAWPAVYHPPTARNLALVARPRFWRDGLAPTRDGWRFRTRDPRYAFSALRARGATDRR